jgi:hypothetical protein
VKISYDRALALAVISTAFVLATSCKKGNSGNTNGDINASLSGSAWATTFPTEGFYLPGAGQFEITGVQYKGGDSTVFTLWFGVPFTLNKAMNSGPANNLDIYYLNEKTAVTFDGGTKAGWATLTVTSYDSTNRKIGGVFNGVVYDISTGSGDSLVITNGSFSSSYNLQ